MTNQVKIECSCGHTDEVAPAMAKLIEEEVTVCPQCRKSDGIKLVTNDND